MKNRSITKRRKSGSAAAVLGLKTFAAISAVEGLKLSSAGRKRVAHPSPANQRRAEVLKAYLDLKGDR